MAYFFGQLAGFEILIKHRNYLLTGIKYGCINFNNWNSDWKLNGFLQEGLKDIGGFANPFYDYYFKPLYWVIMFGIIPAIIVGLLFGRQIKKQGQKMIRELEDKI